MHRPIRAFILDNHQIPIKRLPLKGAITLGRVLNNVSNASYNGTLPCGLNLVPSWHGLGIFEEGRQLALWAGEVTNVEGNTISASDYASIFERRTVGAYLSSRVTDVVSNFMHAAVIDAGAPYQLNIAPASWNGNVPIRSPGEAVYAPEFDRATTISDMLSNLVNLGWWWTMDGTLLRFGRQNTCIGGGMLPTTRFEDEDVLTDSGIAVSQVLGRAGSEGGLPDVDNSSQFSQSAGVFAIYPAEKRGYPPYRVDVINLPTNIPVYVANRIVQDAFNARRFRYAVGTAEIQRRYISLTELVAGRWFNILAPPGTRLNRGMLGVIDATFYDPPYSIIGENTPLTSYGVISTVDVTIDAGCITSTSVTFAAPDELDPSTVTYQLQSASSSGSGSGVVGNSPPVRGAGVDGAGGWTPIGESLGIATEDPDHDYGDCEAGSPVGPVGIGGATSFANVITTFGGAGSALPGYPSHHDIWITFNVSPALVDPAAILSLGINIASSGNPVHTISATGLELVALGDLGCGFEPTVGRLCAHFELAMWDADIFDATITALTPFIETSAGMATSVVTHTGTGSGPGDFPCEYFTGGTPGGPGIPSGAEPPDCSPMQMTFGAAGIYSYANVVTDLCAIGETIPAAGTPFTMWITYHIDPAIDTNYPDDYFAGGHNMTCGWLLTPSPATSGDIGSEINVYGAGCGMRVQQGRICATITATVDSYMAGKTLANLRGWFVDHDSETVPEGITQLTRTVSVTEGTEPGVYPCFYFLTEDGDGIDDGDTLGIPDDEDCTSISQGDYGYARFYPDPIGFPTDYHLAHAYATMTTDLADPLTVPPPGSSVTFRIIFNTPVGIDVADLTVLGVTQTGGIGTWPDPHTGAYWIANGNITDHGYPGQFILEFTTIVPPSYSTSPDFHPVIIDHTSGYGVTPIAYCALESYIKDYDDLPDPPCHYFHGGRPGGPDFEI